jgi:hypothetical protein
MSVVPRPGRIAVLGVLLALCAGGVALAAAPSLQSFLLRSNEQPGFTVIKHTRGTQPTAAAYAKWSGVSPADQKAYAEKLKKTGFVQAAGEQLEGKHGARQGFSLVVEFKTAKGAAALAKSLYKKAVSGQSGAKLKKFTVPGVSTAQGITATEKPVATANVYWTEGRCAFGSGLFLPHGSGLSSKQIASRVIAGVESQHRRTDGRCPAVASTFMD